MRISGYISLIAFLVLAGTATAYSQESDRRDVRRGNREFRDGNFKEAVVDYQKALLRDSTSFAASYNLAGALYKMENYTEARSVLDTVAKAAPESGHASDYYYNLGNTASALEDWQAAVDAYKASLLENPGDVDAKENYIYAKKKLEDQKNNQNNQNQDNQDNKDNQDNQDNQNNQNNQNNQDQDNKDNKDNKDNQDNQNDRNEDNRDQNQDNGNGGSQPQGSSQPQISKQAAQQMLNAIMAKEKETQDKVKKEKAAVMKSRQKEKNW